MTKDEALVLALDALEGNMAKWYRKEPAIEAIKKALQQPTWVGLTNDELTDLFYNKNLGQESAVGQAIALLRERNEKAN
jgi:hypothetical protein